jgi:hypothetical protein
MSERTKRVPRRPAAGILLALGLVLGTAGPAFAQPSTPRRAPRPAPLPEPRRFYLSVTGFGDIERLSNDAQNLLSGRTVGLGVGIGTFITRRWSLEFEGAMPRPIDTGVRVQTLQGSAGGLNMVHETRSRMTHRTDTGIVLLAFHPSRRGHIQMAYAAGLAFVRFGEQFTDDDTYTDQTGTRKYHFATAETYFVLAPVLQIEASIRLSRRLALVPYFKAATMELDRQYGGAGINYASGAGPGAFVFRPGVALRINF